MFEVKHFLFFAGLVVAIETLTVVLRLYFKLESAKWQKRHGWPRVHHAYPGVILAGAGLYTNPWILAFGSALIASDLVHHLVVIPLLRKRKLIRR